MPTKVMPCFVLWIVSGFGLTVGPAHVRAHVYAHACTRAFTFLSTRHIISTLLFTCLCISLHICPHTRLHACQHPRLFASTSLRLYACLHTRLDACLCTCRETCLEKCLNACIRYYVATSTDRAPAPIILPLDTCPFACLCTRQNAGTVGPRA